MNSERFNLGEWREQFIRTVLRVASVLGVFLIISSFATATFMDRVLFISIYLLLLAITILPSPYSLRATLLLSMPILVGVNALLSWGPWADGSIFLLTGITLAALLIDNRAYVVILLSSIIFLLTLTYVSTQGYYQLSAAAAPATELGDWAGYIVDFVIAAGIITLAISMLKGAFTRVTDQMQSAFNALSIERQNLEEAVRDRTEELETRMNQLRASTTTARVIAETQNIVELLNKASDLISENFQYYHTGIYILDEAGTTAYLQSASSEAGKNLIGQALRIESDRRNPITTAIEKNKTIIAYDQDQNKFVSDANFPITRSRMIMPLNVRGEVIGFLDIHSDQPRAFGTQDAEILQTLADLVAISFDNVRLIAESRNLVAQLEANTALQTQRTWSKLTSRRKTGYLYTPAGVRPMFSQNKPESEADGLHIPIILQGQSIGRIKLKRKGSINQWSDRERELVEKISVQVALALENSRLVDEAQRNALRNQMIASFSSSVRETLDIESVVRSAAAELRNVFDLKEAEILIGTSQQETTQ